MDRTKILDELHRVCNRDDGFCQESLSVIAGKYGMSFSELAGTASFYSMFNGRTGGPVFPCTIPEHPARGENRRILSAPRNYNYAGLEAALRMPEKILDQITASGLRGRGGAGFPVGRKWETTRNCASSQKYVVINADEGEPDTAKDSAILRTVPHAVVEGAVICGLCVGASRGYVYIRGEYPEEKAILEREIVRAREEGRLGERIGGTDFSFDLEVVAGAGAYICGEETALLSSLEGKAGEPRLKPPLPGVSGLFEMPTVINNVESIANVPLVLTHGAGWFRECGTKANPGTKVVTVSGRVRRPGVYEFPLGIRVEEALDAAGFDRGSIKALQIGGGASGALLPPEALSASLDIEGIAAAGGALGTGSIRVLGSEDSIPVLCRDAAVFFREESCGCCTPCRLGTERMASLLESLTEGKAREGCIEELRQLAAYIQDTSRCAFGQSAATVLQSGLRLFAEEFEMYLKGGN